MWNWPIHLSRQLLKAIHLFPIFFLPRNDLNKMEYLTMCIKEGLRNYSPVPFIQREFTHDFEVDGHTYPKGTPVTLHIYGLHHNKDLWEKPLSYIPERFCKDNVAKMDPFQFVPFSAGPR